MKVVFAVAREILLFMVLVGRFGLACFQMVEQKATFKSRPNSYDGMTVKKPLMPMESSQTKSDIMDHKTSPFLEKCLNTFLEL